MTALRRDEQGISNVLGAILVFGLLVMTLVTIQVRFVPVWDEEREAKHVDTVIQQLSLFKADAERLATNATGGSVTDPVTVSPEGGFRFFHPASLGGELTFEPSASDLGIVLESPQLRITQRDGVALYALSENWVAITSTGAEEDITDVNHLRVRLVEPNDEDGGDFASLTVTDASGDYAGKAVITILTDPSERSVQTEIFSASSSTVPITVQRESYFQQVDPEFVYVNLLDDELLFGQVLAAADEPFDLALESDAPTDLDADYTVAYIDSEGGSGGSEGGVVVPDYNNTLASGVLSFATRNQRLPEQTFVMEHGAILAVQSDGAVVMVPPAFDVAASSDQVILDWVVPGLAGSDTGMSGIRSASLLASSAGAKTSIEALGALVNVTLPTSYPDAWADFFDERMSSAGLSDSGAQPQYTVSVAADSVTLRVFGTVTDPDDDTEDVFLRYQQATISIELRPTG